MFTSNNLYLVFEVVIVCFSALLLGVLPGRSRGHYWPPFNPQVDGDNDHRKSKSQKVDPLNVYSISM